MEKKTSMKLNLSSLYRSTFFLHSLGLEIDMQMNTGEQSFSCKVCGKAYTLFHCTDQN